MVFTGSYDEWMLNAGIWGLLILLAFGIAALILWLRFYDIRTAKANENKLIRQAHSMQLTLDITNVMAQEESFEGAIKHCLSIICNELEWPIGHLYMIDDADKDRLLPTNLWYLKDEEQLSPFRDITMNTTFSYGDSLPGRVLASGIPIWVFDIGKQFNFIRASVCKKLNIHTAIGFPIKKYGKIIGVVELFTHKLIERDNSLLVAINVLSNQISRFIELQDVLSQNKELARRFKYAVQAGRIGIWEYHPHSDKLIWDDQMFALYGIRPSIFSGKLSDWQQILHPDDLEHVLNQISQAIKDEHAFEVTFRIIKPNKDLCYIRAHAMIAREEKTNYKYILGVNQDITKERTLMDELKAANKTLEQYAHFDALTGLMNRRFFIEAATRAIARAKRHHIQHAILFIDLDHFKAVNDTYGHKIGDVLLMEVAKRFTNTLRDEDKVCRLGGDEFSVLLDTIQSIQGAIAFSQRLIDTLKSPFNIEGHSIHIGTSIGMAIFPQSGMDINTLLNQADLALLQAKKEGRGQVKLDCHLRAL